MRSIRHLTNKTLNWNRQIASTVKKGNNRLRVVMDIDECMVHSSELPANKIIKENQKVLTMEDWTFVTCKRPGLEDYLKEVSSFADMFIFTAGVKTYGECIANYLDPEKKIFKLVLARNDCQIHARAHTKNLVKLGEHFDPARTVLVDNATYSFYHQPENGIQVPDFYEDPLDREFENVLGLLRRLKDEADVRPILTAHDDIKTRVDQFFRRQ